MQHRLRAQIYRWIEELFEQEAKDISFDECRGLVPELELVQDLLNIPERYGPHTTCVNRFNRWRKAGV
jgi:hypothetical protein